MTRATWALLAGILLLAGCSADRKSVTAPEEPEPDPSATFTRVQNEIFTPKCAFSGCHGEPAPQQGLDLRSGHAYGSLVGVAAKESNLLRVAPNDPDGSYVVHKTSGVAGITGERMPLGGPYLTETEQRLLVDWIRRGAPND